MIAERVLLTVLIGGVTAGCILVLYPFFSALLWAGILVFTTWPVAEWLRINARLGHVGAAICMVALTAVIILLPLALAVPGGATDVDHLHTVIDNALGSGLPNAPRWVFTVPVVGPSLGGLWDSWAADITALGEFLRPYFGILLEGGLSLLLGIAHGVILFGLALFIAFFFYLYGEPLSSRLRLIAQRIAGARANRLITVTGATVRGVVYGILGTAVVQGILTSLGLWMTGVPRPVLLGVVAGFLAVLPIGAPLVWIPAAVWLLTIGHVTRGILLAIYGVVAVSGADHLIRPWFISRGAQLPFLLTVLGVLGGALAFGLLGIFLGPVLLGIGFTLVNEWALAAEPRAERDGP
jgi:predicted PurR-regulated permease PerM